IRKPAEAIGCCRAQISRRRHSAQHICRGRKSRFSLCFLLFPIDYLRLSRVARTFLSVAATTGSLLMLCPASAHAQGGVPLWTNRYNGPANGNDVANRIAVDSSGNVFVTGYSENASTMNDYATIKYSGAGVPLWTNYYNGPANDGDAAYAIAVDSTGNVLVTGYSW